QTIEEDLGRRDFTINSIAMPLDAWLSCGDLASAIDPFGGCADLGKKYIRLTYKDAILDDPLRMIRGFRLLTLPGFTLDPSFVTGVKQHRAKIALVSVERILSGRVPAKFCRAHTAPSNAETGFI
ncbi:MAG: hypothetical protein L3J05_07295, partial [Robiginitomaculum sp.]|nr:hypothetical protein [Robiginitomaculum sp.]